MTCLSPHSPQLHSLNSRSESLGSTLSVISSRACWPKNLEFDCWPFISSEQLAYYKEEVWSLLNSFFQTTKIISDLDNNSYLKFKVFLVLNLKLTVFNNDNNTTRFKPIYNCRENYLRKQSILKGSFLEVLNKMFDFYTISHITHVWQWFPLASSFRCYARSWIITRWGDSGAPESISNQMGQTAPFWELQLSSLTHVPSLWGSWLLSHRMGS